MNVIVYGERLGSGLDMEKMEGEDFEIVNPVLRVERNKRNPTGFVITIEDREKVHSIRITSESMKIILKGVIDEL